MARFLVCAISHVGAGAICGQVIDTHEYVSIGGGKGKHISMDGVRSVHVAQFLRRQYRLFCQRHGQSLPFSKWSHRYTGAVHVLLRLVHGRWPIAEPPATALEAFRRNVVQDYDRWLAKVLALVPSAGLDAVLVVVELALESAPPSGRVSEQHVINVLARLNAPPRPANVQTLLQVLWIGDPANGAHSSC
jgi:hypothetical protein